MKDWKSIEEIADKLKIKLNENQCQQFLIYYETLIEWNKYINLTGITEYEEVLIKHFADSLEIVKVIDFNKNHSILDIGTGAGFPGIPLKIAFPDLKITLLDSLNKRINFLNIVIDKLNLIGITAIHGRAEVSAKEKEYRESFDLCVSRAVANLATLSEYCIPYVKIGGNFVSYKSGKIEDELEESKNAIKILGGRIERIENFNLIDTEIRRSLIVIKKEKMTPKQYPRNAGKPSKEPIK